jgi:hypothetical protein
MFSNIHHCPMSSWDILLAVVLPHLLETEGCHFSEFTILCFLPSTAAAPVVPHHSCLHLGLRDFCLEVYSSRSTVLSINLATPEVCDSSCMDSPKHREATYSHCMLLERVKANIPSPQLSPFYIIYIIIIIIINNNNNLVTRRYIFISLGLTCHRKAGLEIPHI